MRRICAILVLLAAFGLAGAPGAKAAFGIAAFDLRYTNEDESADLQAGSHPFAVTNLLEVTKMEDPIFGPLPTGALKDVTVTVPTGLVGNPNATPQCTGPEFTVFRSEPKLPSCANDTAVGTIIAGIYYANDPTHRLNYFSTPVYNLVPPPGSVEKLGFLIAGIPVMIDFTLSVTAPYNVLAHLHYISQVAPVFGSELRLWGNPESPVHDEERGDCIGPLRTTEPGEVQTDGGICGNEGAPERAFLTLPRACTGELRTDFSISSWQEPAAPVKSGVPTPPSPGFNGCEALGFGPKIGAKPSSTSGESPTGLEFSMDIDDPGLTDPTQNADSDLKKAVVTLPKGVTTNPAVASGLQACTLAQYEAEAETLQAAPANGCPQSSKVGEVEIESPLVKPIIHGSVFVAKQHDNPFDNLLTIYMVAKDEGLGVNIRAAGKVDPDPQTGQLRTTFDDLPQLPFSHFRFHFHEGRRAPLITPSTCGNFTTTAELYPWANPTVPLHEEASFEISSGANGGPCAQSEAQLPNRYSFSAGTTSPSAGAYAPFVLRLSREDGTQQLRSITTKLPEGLTGRLAGTPYCSDAQIAQAQGRSGEGKAALELAQPSCPAASEVGKVTAAAGAGPEPYYASGHAYLAGPYKGAPLSLEIITPVIAGPFDLGVVAVRTALNLDPATTEITATSDPIPSILHGLPLDVRSVEIEMAKPQFTLNPTSCEPKSITGSAISTLGATAALDQYFQASDCAKLGFKPKLSLTLKGKTKRTGFPSLRAVFTPRKGDANLKDLLLRFPRSEFIEQGHFRTICTRVQWAAGAGGGIACPKGSVYGQIRVLTPLLDKPLEGPVYLRSSDHNLPDVVFALRGQVDAEVAVRIDSVKGGLRASIEGAPDVPITKAILEMQGGQKGLFVNSRDTCAHPYRATVALEAQNAKTGQLRPAMRNPACRKAHRHGHKRHAKR